MKPNFQIVGHGLEGLPDLGIIRYITALEPIVSLIDQVILAREFTVDITAVKLDDSDFAQLGHDLLHSEMNVGMVSDFYEELSEEKKNELFEAIGEIAEEFRHFRFNSYIDESDGDRALGGSEVTQVYTDLYAMHKAIREEGPGHIADALAAFVLGYAYEWHGKLIYGNFRDSLGYFEGNLLTSIRSIELDYSPGYITPRYVIKISLENNNG